MTPFEAYTIFHSLKLHFTTDSYDYFKYGGRINVSPALFETKKEKPFFIRLAKKYPNKEIFEDFCLANLLRNPKIWVDYLTTEDADYTYKMWLKNIQSLIYNFKNDLDLLEDLVAQLKVKDGKFPYIFEHVSQGTIHLETILILDVIQALFPSWDKKLKDDDIFWPIIRRKYLKYQPFLCNKIDLMAWGKFKKILLDKLKEMK